jgi:hypothetical protein
MCALIRVKLEKIFFSDDDINDNDDIDDDNVDGGVDDVVGGLRGGGNLGFLRAQTREARTPLGVRQSLCGFGSTRNCDKC